MPEFAKKLLLERKIMTNVVMESLAKTAEIFDVLKLSALVVAGAIVAAEAEPERSYKEYEEEARTLSDEILEYIKVPLLAFMSILLHDSKTTITLNDLYEWFPPDENDTTT